MSNTPHTLIEEFSADIEVLRELKASDAHFAKLLLQYDEANDAVHRAETNVEPVEQLVEVELRKKRALVKDEIARMIASAKV